MGETLRSLLPGQLDELVDLAPRCLGHARRDDRLDPAARCEGLVEDTEARGRRSGVVGQRGREVDELEAVPEVRLVRSEALHDLGIGEPWERHPDELPLGNDSLAHSDDHRLHEAHDRGLVDEAHLEVELGELRLAIAPKVLVAEAAGDLEVAVDARHHQELLELLGALRQGVDVARLEAARDEEVTGSLGGRLDEIGCLDLDEAVGVVDLPDRVDEPASKQESPLHRLAADVEVAVLEPERLVDRGVGIVDVERRRLRLAEDRDLGRAKLDLTGLELRVLGAGEPFLDGPDDRYDELVPDPTRGGVRVGRVGPVDDDLGDPVPIADVEEDQATLIAPAVHPAGDASLAARVGCPQLAARTRAVGARVVGAGLGHGPGIVSGRVPQTRPRTAQARATRSIVPSGSRGSVRSRRPRSRSRSSGLSDIA